MKIGIFDSGLGGMLIAQAIQRYLPDYDYLYLGDTLHLPYGKRTTTEIYSLTQKAVAYMFEQGCSLIILACNTASAAALRRIQQKYLPRYYPDRRVLGVVVPTLEATLETGHKNIGLIGTENLVRSNVYKQELKKINPQIEMHAQATPLLVPLIEGNDSSSTDIALKNYLEPLKTVHIDSLILGCTHYIALKEHIRKFIPADVISQDDIIPEKLGDYLNRHPEIRKKLGRNGSIRFEVTDVTSPLASHTQNLFGETGQLHKVAF